MAGSDFEFAWEGSSKAGDPWGELRVVRFSGKEALSSAFLYDVVVLAPADGPTASDLVDRRGALRIATQSKPAVRLVHGVVIEAEELALLPEGRTLRLRLASGWARARIRRRSRIFLGKTLRQIVEAVLAGDPQMTRFEGGAVSPPEGGQAYAPASDAFTFRVEDTSRLDDTRVRAYVVQYGESDFDFVSRLLEEEGIAYHFEHGDDVCLLVFSDADAGRPRIDPDAVGAGIDGREVRAFRAGARLRPGAVVLADYNWKQPAASMDTSAGAEDAPLVDFAYPGGYPDEDGQGAPLARARLERHRTEARYARGEGALRVLSAGTIFRLEHKKTRLEGEYLVASLEVRGEQAGVLKSEQAAPPGEPFEARFECARRGAGKDVTESHFRPARTTPRPRISGTQTAVVTAEPGASGAEIHVGGPDGLDVGCVRLRFHWDKDEARLAKEPSSTWVRVSDVFAGAGQGAVWHPRVGCEVLVGFEEGDPDRPLVTGRVYNGQNLPHRGGAPAISTLKSNAIPGGAVHNEITFDDTAGGELVYTNAGKDMETDVGNDRTETIGGSAAMHVGGNDSESIGGSCTVTVAASDKLSVGANDSNAIGGNGATAIGANCLTLVGGSEAHVVGGSQVIGIGATHTEVVAGPVLETYGATRSTLVAGSETESVGGSRTTEIAASHTQSFGALHAKLVGGDRILSSSTLSTDVGAASLRIAGGSITTAISGPQTLNVSAPTIYITPQYTDQDSSRSDTDAIKLDVTALSLTIGGVEGIAMRYASSTTGVSVSATGILLQAIGAEIETQKLKATIEAAELNAKGAKIRAGVIIAL